jgi:hypothetical protein
MPAAPNRCRTARLHFRSRSPISTRCPISTPSSAAVTRRTIWLMNTSWGRGVDPRLWTRREARSMTTTVSYVTTPRHGHTSAVKKSGAAITPQCALRNVCHEVGRCGTGGGPAALRMPESLGAPRGAPRSSARLGSACSPTWHSRSPSARTGTESQRVRRDDATGRRVRHFRAIHCRCQRSSVSGVTIVAISRNARRRPDERPARRVAVDRHQAGAGAVHPTAVAGGGSLRSDRRAPPALGASQPVRTIGSTWRAEGSVTSGSLYHGRSFRRHSRSARSGTLRPPCSQPCSPIDAVYGSSSVELGPGHAAPSAPDQATVVAQ